MSGTKLASIVKEMRAMGETQLLMDCDGQPVLIELRPKVKAAPLKPAVRPACPLVQLVVAAFRQNVRNN